LNLLRKMFCKMDITKLSWDWSLKKKWWLPSFYPARMKTSSDWDKLKQFINHWNTTLEYCVTTVWLKVYMFPLHVITLKIVYNGHHGKALLLSQAQELLQEHCMPSNLSEPCFIQMFLVLAIICIYFINLITFHSYTKIVKNMTFYIANVIGISTEISV